MHVTSLASSVGLQSSPKSSIPHTAGRHNVTMATVFILIFLRLHRNVDHFLNFPLLRITCSP